MKFKYLFCILLICFICSGCSVTYNLDIDDNLNLDEHISMVSDNDSESKRFADYKYNLPINYDADNPNVFENVVDGVDYYEIKKNADNSTMDFNYKYNIKKFNNNVFARSCYQSVSIMNNYNQVDKRNELLLSTSKEFLCFDSYDNLDSVTVKIHTSRKVYDNNANSVKGNDYIWNINRENYKDATIYMAIDSDKVDNKVSFIEKHILLILIGLLIIAGIVLFIILRKRSEQKNEI